MPFYRNAILSHRRESMQSVARELTNKIQILLEV